MPAGQLADGVVIAGVGEHDADVGQRRLHERDGHVAVGELPVEGVDVVDLDDPRRLRRRHGRAEVAAPGDDPAVGRDPGEGLVDRAVVVVVVDEDLRPARDVPGEPDREPVGVGRRERELPVPEPEPPAELVGGDDRVLGGQHVGDPAAELALDGRDRRGGPVAGHGPGVAEAEVDVLVPVDVAEPGTRRLVDEQRVRAGPADHPVHRDAVEQGALGALEQRPRPRVGPFERGRLGGHEALEAESVQGPARHRSSSSARPCRTLR